MNARHIVNFLADFYAPIYFEGSGLLGWDAASFETSETVTPATHRHTTNNWILNSTVPRP